MAIDCWQDRVNEAAVIPEARFFDLFFSTQYVVTSTNVVTSTVTVPRPCVAAADLKPLVLPATKYEECRRRKRSISQDEADVQEELEELARSSRQAAGHGESSISASFSVPAGFAPRQPRLFGSGPIIKPIAVTVTSIAVAYDPKVTSKANLGNIADLKCIPKGYVLCPQ